MNCSNTVNIIIVNCSEIKLPQVRRRTVDTYCSEIELPPARRRTIYTYCSK